MAGYKPPKVKTNSGLYGAATIELGMSKGKPQAKITFVDGDNEGKVFYIPKDKCPTYVQKGRWSVNLSSDGKELRRMSPINGRFRGKVAKFAAAKGKEPAPFTQTNTFEGKTFSSDVFTVILEFTDAKCKGMQTAYRLNYNFAEAEGGVVGISHLKSKYTRHLERFLDVSGAWDKGEMKYVDNVLPNFEKRILRAAKEFDIQMVDGWVDALYPLADNEELEGEETTTEESEPSELPDEELIDPNEMQWEGES
jgi:hypothetical protein